MVKPHELELDEDVVEILGREGPTRLEVATFVERYLDHIPEKGTVLTRHYGLYSNRQREWRDKVMVKLLQKEPKPKERWKPECPECKIEMKSLGRWKPYSIKSFEPFGFGRDPPEHWTLGKPKI